MSLIIEVSIICDKCNAIFTLKSTTMKGMQLRIAAQQAGWIYSGNSDICPNCRVHRKDGKHFEHSKNRLKRNRKK